MNNSTVIPYPKYYYQFGLIQRLLEKVSLPYIFLIGFIGLITNTTTIVLLSKSFITKNLKTNWTLIALGRIYFQSLYFIIKLPACFFFKLKILLLKRLVYISCMNNN